MKNRSSESATLGRGHWAGATVATALFAAALTPSGAGAAVSFGGQNTYPVGDIPISVAVGDFNADSDPDLVVTNLGDDNVSVLPGGPGGSFGAQTTFATGGVPVSVAIGDFDPDLDLDLAVASPGSGDVSVLLGEAGATFGTPTPFAPGTNPTRSRSATSTPTPTPTSRSRTTAPTTSRSCSAWRADSSSPRPTVAAGDGPKSVAIGDFNGDSDPDLAVVNQTAGTVSIRLGGAGATFTGAANVPVSGNPVSVAVGDFNGDSDPDLAVVNQTVSGSVSILLGGPGGDVRNADAVQRRQQPGPRRGRRLQRRLRPRPRRSEHFLQLRLGTGGRRRRGLRRPDHLSGSVAPPKRPRSATSTPTQPPTS